jgi:hypothetical protein
MVIIIECKNLLLFKISSGELGQESSVPYAYPCSSVTSLCPVTTFSRSSNISIIVIKEFSFGQMYNY